MMRKYLERVVSQAFGSSLLDGVARADVHGVLLAVQQSGTKENRSEDFSSGEMPLVRAIEVKYVKAEAGTQALYTTYL